MCGNAVNISLCKLRSVVNYMAYAIHLEIHMMSNGYSDFQSARDATSQKTGLNIECCKNLTTHVK